MQVITNNNKKLIKQLSLKKFRDEHSMFVAEGAKLICDLLQKGARPVFVAVTQQAEGQVAGLLKDDVRLLSATEKDIKEVTQLSTAPQAIAVFEKPQYAQSQISGERIEALLAEVNDSEFAMALVLDEVQNPGNMGTIIRTADWFGIKTIICGNNCADVWSGKCVQATMGALLRVKIVETDLAVLLARNKQKNKLPVYGTLLEGDNIYQIETGTAPKGLVIMGNEGRGINDELKGYITQKLYIPQGPSSDGFGSESLNVSIATAVVCSEMLRRWQSLTVKQ